MIIATVDQELTTELRLVPGVPIILFVREKMLMDDPSAASQAKVEEVKDRNFD